MDWRLEPVIVRVSERQNTVRAAHAAGLGCSIAVGKGPIDTVPGSCNSSSTASRSLTISCAIAVST